MVLPFLSLLKSDPGERTRLCKESVVEQSAEGPVQDRHFNLS